jgi:hypothetical protein
VVSRRFCVQCGHALKPETRFCTTCGRVIGESDGDEAALADPGGADTIVRQLGPIAMQYRLPAYQWNQL